MIYDTLENIDLYSDFSARMKEGIALLKRLLSTIPDSEIEEGNEGMYGSVRSYETQISEEKQFESHIRHIDIQCLAGGRERVFIEPYRKDHDFLTSGPYSEESDVQFFSIDSDSPLCSNSSFVLEPGNFVILFPQDLHKPGCIANGLTKGTVPAGANTTERADATAGGEEVLKVVVKVPVMREEACSKAEFFKTKG